MGVLIGTWLDLGVLIGTWLDLILIIFGFMLTIGALALLETILALVFDQREEEPRCQEPNDTPS